jgi:gas vesicle protein
MMNGRDVVIGAAIGATVMFLGDPNGGRRRRALMRDNLVRATRKTRDGLDATARDLTNRASGITAAARGRWADDHVDDGRLIARVRAKLGRVCSHPHAVDVDAQDGTVTLRGPVLASEVNDILAVVAGVRGWPT